MVRTTLGSFVAAAATFLLPPLSQAAVSMSAKAYVELVFTEVREIPQGQPAGRSGLKFEQLLSGFGFTGGSASDAESDANIDIGYLGGFPDGKAPIPGTGMFIAFNPVVSCSETGDAYGIGSLIMQLAMTDQTAGGSRWEITAVLRSRIEALGTSPPANLGTSYWSAMAGFDLTDADSAYEQTLLADQGWYPQVSVSRSGQPVTIRMVIQGDPQADPAQALVSLKTEAQARVSNGPETQPVAFEWNFATDRAEDRVVK